MRKIVLLMGVVSSLAMTACGVRTCSEVCEKPCEGATTTNCRSVCARTETVAKAASCEQKYNTFIGCISGLNDIERCSSLNTNCKAESDTVSACVATYCGAHPNDAACKP